MAKLQITANVVMAPPYLSVSTTMTILVVTEAFLNSATALMVRKCFRLKNSINCVIVGKTFQPENVVNNAVNKYGIPNCGRNQV